MVLGVPILKHFRVIDKANGATILPWSRATAKFHKMAMWRRREKKEKALNFVDYEVGKEVTRSLA